MTKEIKSDDVIFNFFKQMCDEKDDLKCVKLGNSWIESMKTNLTRMEENLKDVDKIKYIENIKKNRDSDNSFKVTTAALNSFGKLVDISSKSIKTPYYI